jgi:RNA polymerase sigma-70 factor (ECF subfamily)
MAQRLVRAKQKIREAKIPYQVPSPEVLPERLDGVLRAVYLMFNEGYTATVGDVLIRQELCREAICLGRVLCELLPTYPETHGLLALLLLHDSRRDARINATGEIILLEEQERWRWDWSEIREGIALVEKALHLGNGGFYTVQAAIAAVHAQAERAEDTDWRQIAELYDILLRRHPSAIIELNRAVAVAMAHGLEHGLEIIAGIEARGDLHNYHLLPAARADLLRRLGRRTEAANAYQQALSLVTNETERRFLERRLEEMRAKAS